jgi:hypothetical protein
MLESLTFVGIVAINGRLFVSVIDLLLIFYCYEGHTGPAGFLKNLRSEVYVITVFMLFLFVLDF